MRRWGAILVGKVPGNDWPMLDPLSAPRQGSALPRLWWMASGQESFQAKRKDVLTIQNNWCYFFLEIGTYLILITTQEKHFTRSSRKDSTNICVLLLSLFYWIQNECRGKLKPFRVVNIPVTYAFLQQTSSSVAPVRLDWLYGLMMILP